MAFILALALIAGTEFVHSGGTYRADAQSGYPGPGGGLGGPAVTGPYLLRVPLINRGVPASTYSRYMDVIDSTSLNNLGSARGGCNNSGQAPTGSGLVVLAFGQAWTIGSVQGVKIYAPNLPFYTISQVETAMRSFIGGYVGCVKALPGISLTVAVGLNNSGNTTAMSSAHGTAWAGMINNLRSYINNHLPETVEVDPKNWRRICG